MTLQQVVDALQHFASERLMDGKIDLTIKLEPKDYMTFCYYMDREMRPLITTTIRGDKPELDWTNFKMMGVKIHVGISNDA